MTCAADDASLRNRNTIETDSNSLARNSLHRRRRPNSHPGAGESVFVAPGPRPHSSAGLTMRPRAPASRHECLEFAVPKDISTGSPPFWARVAHAPGGTGRGCHFSSTSIYDAGGVEYAGVQAGTRPMRMGGSGVRGLRVHAANPVD